MGQQTDANVALEIAWIRQSSSKMSETPRLTKSIQTGGSPDHTFIAYPHAEG